MSPRGVYDHQRRPLAERFWEKVDRRGPAECWPWLAHVGPQGYGAFSLNAAEGQTGAHRIAWELTHGPIPGDLTIDHLCFTRRCQNPAHMELMTRAENGRRGAVRRGPGGYVRGEQAGTSKLTDLAVTAMRAAYRQGESLASIAVRLDLSLSGTWDALRGKTWAHVPGAISPSERHRPRSLEYTRRAA